MTTVELIAELHEIKDLLCDAVRNVPAFSYVEENTRLTNHIHNGQRVYDYVLTGKTWTIANNVTKEFERLIKLCGKGTVFDINMKKFELKKKIPIVQNKLFASQILDATTNHNKLVTLYKNMHSSTNKYIVEYNSIIDSCNLALSLHGIYADYRSQNWFIHIYSDYDFCSHSNNIKWSQLIITSLVTYDVQATALHTRLTALINMIPVKKVYAKKVVVVKEELKPTTSTLLLNPKIKIHQISLENYEIRTLKQSDCLLQINNLSEFANVQFYFHKSQYNELYLHYKGHAQYLIGNDHKLYVINGVRLVQGIHYDKLQCWTCEVSLSFTQQSSEMQNL